jgi:hypothetical protein
MRNRGDPINSMMIAALSIHRRETAEIFLRAWWDRLRPGHEVHDQADGPDQPSENRNESPVRRITFLGIAHDPDRDEKPDGDQDYVEDAHSTEDAGGSGSAQVTGSG